MVQIPRTSTPNQPKQNTVQTLEPIVQIILATRNQTKQNTNGTDTSHKYTYCDYNCADHVR